MRAILLVQNACAGALDNAFHSSGYQLRIIQDAQSLNLHIREFAPEMVIFNSATISDNLLDDIEGLIAATPLPVMVFTDSVSAGQINSLIQAEVSLVHIGPFPAADAMETQIGIAVARFQYLQALKQALEEARAQLEDRKQIDRAKAILIKARGFSEDDAYHTLRKLAMGRNVTLGEMARNVIAMADLLK